MAIGRPLGAKLFLEGIEVPLIGATVTYAVGQASIAYIDVVPHKYINAIKPRTHVSLFARDYYAPKAAGNLNYPQVLAFEGEVFGFGFSKTPSSRMFTISAIDYTSYWDNVVAYFFNALQSLGKGAEQVNMGMDINDAKKQGINQITVSHSISSYFLQIVKEELNKKKSDGTPADFLDALVGVYKRVSKLNDFYSLAEDRLRIIERIRLHSSGELSKLLEVQQSLDWFNGILGRNTGFTTLRAVIQDLMSIIFHDYVSIPFPAKVRSSNLSGEPIQFVGDAAKRTIGNFIFKPNLYMMPPPTCNIFYPDEYSNFSFNRNFFQEPTRLIYKPELPYFGQAGNVALPHVYEPNSFDCFMRKKGSYPSELIGSEDLQVPQDWGHFSDKDFDEESAQTNQGNKREAQFLTNEELMKGILLSQESMVPAASQFRYSLKEAGRVQLSQMIAKYLFFKKRFQGRDVQITSHLKLSVVPGFPVLILDDSDADQSVIAYCSSVTHRIYATQGGYTNVQLSYARCVNEQDQSSGKAGEPIVPPWFSAELFGAKGTPPKSEAASEEVKELGEQILVPKRLSEFYQDLLGDKGSNSINDIANESTMTGATRFLINEYRSVKKKNKEDIPTLIAKRTSRDYVTLRQAFKFLGSGTSRKDIDTTNFNQFFGDRFEGKSADGSKTRDAGVIKTRRDVILKYRDVLLSKRGFRG
jgi:hypothetical protein